MLDVLTTQTHYAVAIWGLWLLLTTALLQTIIATAAHRKQSVYVPGQVDTDLGHNSSWISRAKSGQSGGNPPTQPLLEERRS